MAYIIVDTASSAAGGTEKAGTRIADGIHTVTVPAFFLPFPAFSAHKNIGCCVMLVKNFSNLSNRKM